jgi:hypothetical protein
MRTVFETCNETCACNTASSSGPICPACDKSVFKMEEIVCVGKPWHKLCLTCGGTGELGCGKNISREAITEHESQPYCKACHGRLFAAGGSAYNLNSSSMENVLAAVNEDANHDIDVIKGLSGVSVSAPAPAAPPAPAPPAPVAPAPVPTPKAAAALGGTGAPKCTACAKSVYKMEELLAIGRTWHAACFVCGGTGETKKKHLSGGFIW